MAGAVRAILSVAPVGAGSPLLSSLELASLGAGFFFAVAFFGAGFGFIGMLMPGMFMCCAETGAGAKVSASALAAR